MSEETSETSKRLEIRKYPNRRYYDTTRSRHVTLEQIHALIREGYEVRVIDSKTGTDITAKVLAQIIIELDAPKLGVFPVAMLHRLLQSNQGLVSEFIQKYFNQPLSAFLESQRNAEQYLRQAMGLKTASSTVSDWTRLMWGPFNPAFWTAAQGAGGSGPTPSAATAAAPASGPAPETQGPAGPPPQGQNGGEDAELRGRLEALSRQVSELQAERTRGSRKRSRRTQR